MPESPRWLVQKDRQEDALQVLGKIHAGGDVNDPYVQAEFAEIVAKITYEKTHPQPTYLDLLVGSECRRMWIGIGVVNLPLGTNNLDGPCYLTLSLISNSGNP